jgi:hypothetical protein
MVEYQSDARQDEFVTNLLGFKKSGTYVDIGSCDSRISNNTYFMSSHLGWKGICIERDKYNSPSYNRQNNLFINEDATMIEYDHVFKSFFGGGSCRIDYLSLDVDTDSLCVLGMLPMSSYTFSVITIEHDAYLYGDHYRQPQRDLLLSQGYELLCSDVLVEQSGFDRRDCPFEDWWVFGDFDKSIVREVRCSFQYPSAIIQRIKNITK